MATKQQACNSCKGGGVLQGNKGYQVCPNCGGSGTKDQQVLRVLYDYVFPAVVLTAGQVGLQQTLKIDQSADFEWIWIVSSQTGLYSVQLTDNSTGRTLSSDFVNNENFAGTAQLPFPLVEPYLLARSGSISGAFNDRSGEGNTVQLVLKGYKLFPVTAPQQGSSGMIVTVPQS